MTYELWDTNVLYTALNGVYYDGVSWTQACAENSPAIDGILDEYRKVS